MTTDTAFIAQADATLARIAEALERALAASDVDGDWRLADGILTLEFDAGGRVIVNRHVPTREIWVAARSGGFHFRPQDGLWRDTRSGEELGTAVARLVGEQAGLALPVPLLPA